MAFTVPSPCQHPGLASPSCWVAPTVLLWEIKQEKNLSQESPDCEQDQEGRSNFIIISLIIPSSPLQNRRFGAFSVKLLGVWKVPGESSDLGGVGSGANSKTKSAHLQQDLCGME